MSLNRLPDLSGLPRRIYGEGVIISPFPPRNNPHHLLSCHRIYNPGQHQPGHRHKQGPEYFLDLLILPERLDRRIRSGYTPTIHIKYVNTHKYV